MITSLVSCVITAAQQEESLRCFGYDVCSMSSSSLKVGLQLDSRSGLPETFRCVPSLRRNVCDRYTLRQSKGGWLHACSRSGNGSAQCTDSRNDIEQISSSCSNAEPELPNDLQPSLTRRHVALGASSMLLAAGMPPSLSLMTLMQVQQSSCQCSCAQKRQWPKEC